MNLEVLNRYQPQALAVLRIVTALAFMALFQLGEGFAVLLAGLQEIPRDYYQAAALDGAGRWSQFRYITLPRLQPIFITAIMLSAILTSASIQFVYILTNGGPADRTQIFPTLAYNLALGGAQRLGMGATVSLFFFPLLVVLIIFLTRRMLREREE